MNVSDDSSGSDTHRHRATDIRYPRYARTQVPYVMTTDFLVTVKVDDGSLRGFARTVITA
jgi:hypothetical protein